MPLTPQDQQAIVGLHNTYRSDPAINTPSIAWDETLAASAQSWANNLATTVHQMQHDQSIRGTYGENIASGTAGKQTPAQLADIWKTDEQPHFKPGIFPDVSKDGHAVGHYTQLIWRATSKVGCGIATDSTTGQDYLVCRYSAPGNMDGVGVPSPQPVTLTQISALDAKNVFGVDTANAVYWYGTEDGTTWTRSQISGKQIKQVSVASDLTLCGLDTSGVIWKCDLSSSPQTWTQMPGAAPIAFKHFSCGSATNVWAIGTDSSFYQYNGTSWSIIKSGYNSGALVSVASDTTVWEIAYTKGLYYYTPTGWAQPSVPGGLGGGATYVSCGSSTNIWIVGADGKYYQYDGTNWKTPAVGNNGTKQVSVASSDQAVWALGTSNQVSRWTDPTWTPLLM